MRKRGADRASAPVWDRLFFDEAPCPAWIICERTRRILDVNRGALSAYGYTRDEFLGMRIEQLSPVAERARQRAQWRRAGRARPGGLLEACRHVTKGGTLLEVRIAASPLPAIGKTPTRRIGCLAWLEADRMSGDAAQAVFDRAPIGLLIVDREGRVVGANLSASKTLGTPQPLVCGRLLRELVPAGATSRLGELARAIGEGHSWGGTIGLQDGAGRIFDAELRASPAADGDLRVVAFEDVSDRSRADAALRRSGERYRRLSDHDRAVREEERSRLARELHDQLGQSLSAFKMDLAWLTGQTRRGEPETARAAIAGMMNRVDTAISIVRRIAGDLRPSVLDRLGLVAAIEWQAAEFERRSGVRCQIVRQGGCPPLDRAQSTEIFRIVQETLLNVSRHAGASCVKIRMTCSPARVAICVSDNGRGIPQEAIDSDRSLGLIGMRERALILGGTLTLSRGARRGTEALLVVPSVPRLVGPQTPARTTDR